jgi:glutamate racemase
MTAEPIGVFDSGIGGLTVVRALMKQLPHENIVYYGDTARVPYGTKSPQVIREYAAQDADFLVSQGIKMLVVACNTVSAVALDIVQKRARVPVVGVIIPGARAAVSATRKKRVGIIGTSATVNSGAYTNAVRQIDEEVQVFARACPLFVPLADEGWIDHQVTMFPLTLEKVDTLILGCTHYPVLRSSIAAVLDPRMTLIDSGAAAALEVERVLDEQDIRNPSKQKPNLQFFVSDLPAKFSEIGERFLGQKMGRVRRVPL